MSVCYCTSCATFIDTDYDTGKFINLSFICTPCLESWLYGPFWNATVQPEEQNERTQKTLTERTANT